MGEPGIPIAYSALDKGVAVVTRSGQEFGVVDQVLGEEDIFHGIVVDTPSGKRFVDRDHVQRMTTTQVSCSLSDTEAAGLPSAPEREPDDADRVAPSTWLGRAWRNGPGTPNRADGSGWLDRLVHPPVVVVRCSRGGVFQTVWVPLISLRAIRLGPYRLQRCPIHERPELVRPVDPTTLSYEELAQAARYPAGRLP